uniref:Uncharacterized protein n=1 Tax=Homalodisca liturata TaxID=320908 RepID=A0A1B6IT91_9HEMI
MDIDIPLPGEEVPLSEIEPPDIPMPDDPPEPFRGSPVSTPAISAESTLSEPSQEDPEEIYPVLPSEPGPFSTATDDESYDPNRYSPSVPMEEDDLPVAEVSNVPPLLPPPPPPPSLAPLPSTSNPALLSSSPTPSSTQTRSLVLGKTQAKKRLLAFSMTKQGGGTGVSFNLAKKPTISKESAKGFSDEKEDAKKKPSKKGTVDKARDTISEIEELKRKETFKERNCRQGKRYNK